MNLRFWTKSFSETRERVLLGSRKIQCKEFPDVFLHDRTELTFQPSSFSRLPYAWQRVPLPLVFDTNVWFVGQLLLSSSQINARYCKHPKTRHFVLLILVGIAGRFARCLHSLISRIEQTNTRNCNWAIAGERFASLTAFRYVSIRSVAA